MKSEKQFLLDDVQNKIATSEIALAFSYQNMDANLHAEFRDALSESGGSLYVIKKRIFMKAAQEEGISVDLKDLAGHIAIMFSGTENAVESTKALYKFKESHSNTLDVLCGQFQGQVCYAPDFETISKLPTQDEMRAELLSVFEAPMAQTLSVVESLLTSVMHCLENKASQDQ